MEREEKKNKTRREREKRKKFENDDDNGGEHKSFLGHSLVCIGETSARRTSVQMTSR